MHPSTTRSKITSAKATLTANNVADGSFASFRACSCDFRFSNRPFGVKHFQTVHRYSVDVAHGLVLLFGIGTKALVWGFFSQEV